MSHTLRATTLPAGQGAAAGDDGLDSDEGLVIDAEAILDRIWHIAISMRTALVLMITLAVLALFGTLLVQAPTGMAADPEAYSAWLESVRPKYGGWTNVLDTLGFFAIFTVWWFKVIVLLLATSIASCSLNRSRKLWRAATRPRTRMSAGFYAHAPHAAALASALPSGETSARVSDVLRHHHFRTVLAGEGSDEVHVYADRFRWAPFGTVVAHLSVILVLIGAVVGSNWGFHNSSFAVPVGSTVDVGYGTGLAVKAVSFSDAYYESGAPSDYASKLVLYQNGTQVAEQTIRVNQPLSYGDVKFFQSFFGPATVISVADSNGKQLFNEGVPLLWSSNDGLRRIGRLTVDDPKLTIFVAEAASGQVDPAIKAGQVRFEVYRSETDSTPIAMQVATQGQPVQIAGLTFTFLREQQFTGLIVAKDPAQILVWLGAVLLVGGMFLVFFFPNRRVWARIHLNGAETEVQVGATTGHDASFTTDFQRIVDDIRLGLDGSSRAH